MSDTFLVMISLICSSGLEKHSNLWSLVVLGICKSISRLFTGFSILIHMFVKNSSSSPSRGRSMFLHLATISNLILIHSLVSVVEIRICWWCSFIWCVTSSFRILMSFFISVCIHITVSRYLLSKNPSSPKYISCPYIENSLALFAGIEFHTSLCLLFHIFPHDQS